jgi:ribosomal protein S18 acetylase RimI-like enzyme
MQPQEEGLVPFHPFRHLGAVADLIAEAFADELGPWARYTLQRMRQIARWGPLGALLWASELEQETPGFVWIADGRVVGNVSFRRSVVAGGWMIGNVAVHPQWRRRAIGRALMEAALDEIARRGGTWVGLEVREDNPVAVRLYEHLGFEVVGSSLEMLRPAGETRPPSDAPLPALRRARAADSDTLYTLAREGLARTHQEVLEIRRSAYRAGWEAFLSAWLEGRTERWWTTGDRPPVGALRVTSHRPARWHEVEVLVQPQRIDDLGPALVEAALARLPRRTRWETATVLPGVRAQLEPYFARAGFRPLRRLLQMRRPLGTPVEIRIAE